MGGEDQLPAVRGLFEDPAAGGRRLVRVQAEAAVARGGEDLHRAVQEVADEDRPLAAALGDPVAAAALRALHADPAAPWTNERLAERAGVSRPILARRFTSLVGRPPMAYLTWWRLSLAAALLRDGDQPLAAIARQVGYGSPYALSHAFSRAFGTTPGRYRAQATASPSPTPSPHGADAGT